MRLKILCILSCVFLFTSCDTFLFRRKIDGRVQFKSTGAAVRDAHIFLLETNNGNGGNVVGTTFSDGEGKFSLTYNIHGGDLLTLFVSSGKLGTQQVIRSRDKTVIISL
jgi:hypothetical protein